MNHQDHHADRTRTAAKPWYRVRNIVLAILALFALGVGFIVYETLSLLNARPNLAHDHRGAFIADVLKETGADPARAQEAWDVLMNAVTTSAELRSTAHQQLKEAYRFVLYEPRFKNDSLDDSVGYGLYGPSVDPRLDRERELIARIVESEAFQALDRFLALAPAIDQRLHGEMLLLRSDPSLGWSIWFTRVLHFRGRLALEAGDVAAAVHCYKVALALAQAWAHEASLLARLVAITNNAETLLEITRAIDSYELTEASCLELLEALRRFELPAARLAVLGERVVLMDWVQHTFSDDGNGGGYVCARGGGEYVGIESEDGERTFIEALLLRFIGPRRAEMTKAIEGYFAWYLAELDKAPVDRWQSPDTPALDEHPLFVKRILDSLLPAFENALENDLNVFILRQGVMVALELERFRARTGRDPESLAEVEAALGVTLPVDPLHGASFGYRRLDQPDEHGRTYLLYSVGFDQTDNGGVEPARDEHPRWFYAAVKDRTGAVGFDFIINRPREPWIDADDPNW